MSEQMVAVNHPCQRCGQSLQSGVMCTVQLHGVQPTGHWHFDCTPALILQSAASTLRPMAHLDPVDRVRALQSHQDLQGLGLHPSQRVTYPMPPLFSATAGG